MRVSLEIPDSIAPKTARAESEVLEAVAFHAYAQRKISQGKLAELLGLSIWETEERLAALGITRPFTSADVISDVAGLNRIP